MSTFECSVIIIVSLLYCTCTYILIIVCKLQGDLCISLVWLFDFLHYVLGVHALCIELEYIKKSHKNSVLHLFYTLILGQTWRMKSILQGYMCWLTSPVAWTTHNPVDAMTQLIQLLRCWFSPQHCHLKESQPIPYRHCFIFFILLLYAITNLKIVCSVLTQRRLEPLDLS